MATEKNTVSDKKTALDSAIKQIEKLYGKNAVMRLGANSHLNVASISTGSLTLDIATGINGLPKGRIVEATRLSEICAKTSLGLLSSFFSTTSRRFSPIMASPTSTPARARMVLGRLAVLTSSSTATPPLKGPPAMTRGTWRAAS